MTITFLRPPTLYYFDASAPAFVDHCAREMPYQIWDAGGLWFEYADWFANFSSDVTRPLTRSQFFRQLKGTRIRRFRSGAKDERGKRPYLYRLASSKRPGRIVDARPCNVAV